ncbi:MAG: UDP-N-acetyl glucosamine 2-epimerase [Renibacterium salmoninarum]|nr:UDP-N-acetyl glucosamine 2-epimerase [Renibacterium salmoninarum]
MKTVLAYFGTHAEAIKVAPVAARLADSSQLAVRVVPPHDHMAGPSLAAGLFGIRPEHAFPQNRKSRHARLGFGQLLAEAGQFLAANRPDAVLVHASGRDSSALAMAAAHLLIPLASLDTSAAALATKIRHRHPTGGTADLYLEANHAGCDQLLAEGVPAASIELTGSTTIDSLLHGISSAQAGRRPDSTPAPLRRLLTGSATPILAILRGGKDDAAVAGIVDAMLDSAAKHPERSYLVSAPAAMGNFRWRRPATALPNVTLCGSLDFRSYCRLLARSKLVLTDDSSVLTEAGALGKPVLPAASAGPGSSPVDPIKIAGQIESALQSPPLSTPSEDPFGDGLASLRCAAAVSKLLGLGETSLRPAPAASSRNFIRPVRTGAELVS